jgi:hypothetical protein
MEVVVVGVAFVGSVAAAFVVQKAVLGAMLRTLYRGRTTRPIEAQQNRGFYQILAQSRF